jgi:hypothetical protein
MEIKFGSKCPFQDARELTGHAAKAIGSFIRNAYIEFPFSLQKFIPQTQILLQKGVQYVGA